MKFATGKRFGVYGGDAKGTVLSVGSDRDKTVTYVYDHNLTEQQSNAPFAMPATDLQKIAFELDGAK